MVAHPHDDDAMKSRVRLPVASAVQPMAGRLAAGGWDRTGAAKLGKGGFGADPIGNRPSASPTIHLIGSPLVGLSQRKEGRQGGFDLHAVIQLQHLQAVSLPPMGDIPRNLPLGLSNSMGVGAGRRQVSL